MLLGIREGGAGFGPKEPYYLRQSLPKAVFDQSHQPIVSGGEQLGLDAASDINLLSLKLAKQRKIRDC